jgi:hypothetical protein
MINSRRIIWEKYRTILIWTKRNKLWYGRFVIPWPYIRMPFFKLRSSKWQLFLYCMWRNFIVRHPWWSWPEIEISIKAIRPAMKDGIFECYSPVCWIRPFKVYSFPIKDHRLLFMCLHGDEINALLVGRIGTKIFNKWVAIIQFIVIRHALESLCCKAAGGMCFDTALTGGTTQLPIQYKSVVGS